MSRPGLPHVVGTALAIWFALAVASAAASEDYKIIVNPDNPVAALDRQFLRDAFLRKTSDWNGGEAIRPIDLANRFPVRDRFAQDVLKKSPSQLKSYWNQQIFSGKGVPPPEADSTAAVVAYVLAHRGAVAYLPLEADAGAAKVVKVK
jgi:ABC-type phosphate transport system substrate-binding protein